MELIAHRGASAVAPESTQAALLAAVQAKAGMVELDVQMTQDKRLVIFHDNRLERTTSGRGRLTSKTYPELKRLDSGSWFDSSFSGESILLASQVFKILPKRTAVNLELKRTRKRLALTKHVLRMLSRLPASRRVVISSFDQKLIRPFSHRSIPSALIARRKPKYSLNLAIRLGCQAWHPHTGIVTPKLIREAHAAGLKVRVWTVDDSKRARQLMRWGADGIFTNNPKRLRRIIT